MPIPTEPIGSIPRPQELIEGIQEFNAGRLSQEALHALRDRATGAGARPSADARY